MNPTLYLAIIHALTFVLYWHDKRMARRHGAARVPEFVLLLSGFAGGTLAAISAQQMLRHKTRKQSFQFKFWALTVVQIALLLFPPAALKAIFARFLA
ncbi:MAG: DUF1294 domain-containing protein [Rickettsiales bacterium]